MKNIQLTNNSFLEELYFAKEKRGLCAVLIKWLKMNEIESHMYTSIGNKLCKKLRL
jgi:hypothetical protein